MRDADKTREQLIEELHELRAKLEEAEKAESILNALMEYLPEGIAIAEGASELTLRRVSRFAQEHTSGLAGALVRGPSERHADAWDMLRADGVSRAADEELPLARAAFRGEVVRDEAWVLRRPDGSQTRVLCNAGPIRNDAGEITGSLLAWRDVTGAQEREEALRESEKKYRTLFDSMLEGFCIVEMIFDSDGRPFDCRFLEVNPKFEEQTGLREAQGRSMSELAPDHEADWFEIFGQIAVTGESRRFVNEAKALNRWYEVYAFRLGEEASRKVAICFSDITEHKRAEEKLKKAQEEALSEKSRLEAVMEALPIGVGIFDAQGGIVRSNSGYDRVWSGPRPVTRSVSDYSAYRAWWVDTGRPVEPEEWGSARAVQRGETVTGQLIQVGRFDGTRAIVLNSAAPIRGSHDEIVGCAVAILEITERFEAEERIRHQNAILEAINRIFHEALTCETEEELGLTCLRAAEELTQSKFGFIGEIGPDGLLHDIAMSDPGWELCAMHEKSGHRRLPGDFALRGLYGRVLLDGRSLFTREPASHPDSIGTPEGHPPIHAFLGSPLIRNGETVGLVALGNRVGGYTEVQQQALEAITPAMVQTFLGKRAEMGRRESEQNQRKLFDSNIMGIVYADMDRIYDANDVFLEMIGYGRDDLASGLIDWRRMTPAAYWGRDDHALKELIETGRCTPYEKEFFRRDGGRVSILIGAALLSAEPFRWVCFVLDISERRQMEEELRRSELRFRLLSDVAGRLLTSENPQGLVDELCQRVMHHLDCQVFFNFLVDERAGKLHLNAFAGIPDEEARQIEWLDYGMAVCGCVAREGKEIIAEDIFHTPDSRTELVQSFGIHAYASHPLKVQGRLIGTLSFGTRTRSRFSPEDLALMKTVTDQVATAMERMRLIEELRASRDALELRVEERTAELQTYMGRLQASNQVLRLMTEASNRKDFLTGVVELVKEWTGCRCVGVRIADDEGNIPYEAHTGFAEDFLAKENCLSLTRDSCACTRVIAGAPEPQDACCMTARGSFVVNDAGKLAESLSEEALRRFRGVCIEAGFLTIAVLPLRENGKLLGGLHLADERAGMLPEPGIRFLESFLRLIGEGIIKFNAADALERQKELLETIVNHIPVMLSLFDPKGKPLLINPAFERLLGWSLEDARHTDLMVECYPDSAYRSEVAEYMAKGTAEWREFSVRAKTGESVEAAWSNVRLRDGSHIGIGIDLRERKQAERIIRERTRLFEAFFENAINPLVFLDREFNFIRVNEAYARACEKKVEDFPGHNHFELYPHAENQALFEEVVRTRKPCQAVAKPFIYPDHPEWGVMYWDWILVPICDERGEVEFLVFSLNNVTERAKAEHALKKSEELLRRIMDTLPVGLWITDERGNIVSINAVGQEIWGGMKIVGIERYGRYKGWRPDTGERLRTHDWALARAFEKGETVLNEEVEIENFEGARKFILNSAAPVRGEDGKILSAIGLVQDITDRKRAQIGLERANRALRVLSESNYTLVEEREELELLTRVCRIIVETGGYRLAWVGYADEDEGKHVRAVTRWGDETADYVDAIEVSWADSELGRGPTGRAIRKGQFQTARDFSTDQECSLWRETARKFGLRSSAAFPLVVQGKILGALTIYASEPDAFHEQEEEVGLLNSLAENLAYGIDAIRVREEHKRAEIELKNYMKKLEESNQALQDFASIASHDMQEPLRKIISFGKMLQEKHSSFLDEIACDYLARMQNAAGRMQTLLHALLHYSRITTKAEPFITVNLAEIVEGVLDDLEVRISQTEGIVEVGALPTLQADPNQMRQLFQNLIGNALKYHGNEKPWVKVYAEPAQEIGLTRICVEDNGIGFDPEYVQRIFQPFQRLHGRSSRFEGTGMGLAICKKIVERHGGTLTARSRPGEGSTFIVDLPLRQPWT